MEQLKRGQVIDERRAVEAITDTSGSGFAITAYRTEKTSPEEYRLARKVDGTLVLQGAFFWQEHDRCGYEWRDIPTVEP